MQLHCIFCCVHATPQLFVIEKGREQSVESKGTIGLCIRGILFWGCWLAGMEIGAGEVLLL